MAIERNPHRKKYPVPDDRIIPGGIRDRARKAIRPGIKRENIVQKAAGKSFHGKFYKGRRHVGSVQTLPPRSPGRSW